MLIEYNLQADRFNNFTKKIYTTKTLSCLEYSHNFPEQMY